MKSIPSAVNIFLTLIVVIVLVAVGLPRPAARAAEAISQAAGAAAECDPTRTVQVSGTAVINVVPDRVLIQLGVQSNGISPAEVQRRNGLAIQRVKTAIQALGVAGSDLSSDNYIIEPIYQDYDSLYIKGYRINNVLAVTLRQVDLASRVIAAAFEAGANQVVNVEFYTSTLRTTRDQARTLAMEAAAQKAAALAQAVGADTGCVLNISEDSWSTYRGWWNGGSQALWTQNVVQNATAAGGEGDLADEGPVSLGHISIQAQVVVTFSLQ